MKKVWLMMSMGLLSITLAADIQVSIDVNGMTCSLCVTSINQALRKTEGVIKAKASLKSERVDVIVPENFDHQKLLEAIAKTGYQGEIKKVTVLP